MSDAIEAIVSRLRDATAGDADAVHRARVASRRLREALALVDAVAADADAGRARREVRRLTRTLGPVREADVTLETLADAVGRHRWSRAGVAAVRRRLDAERARARRRLAAKVEALDVEAVRARITQVIERLELAPASDQWRRAVGTRVVGRADALGAAVKRCGILYAPERLHAVRIAVKKLRYALEIAGAAGMLGADAELSVLQQAQESFGQLHDLQILLAEVRAAAGIVRRTAMGEILESMVATLERDCRQRHAAALAVLPTLADHASAIRRSAMVLRGRRRMLKVATALQARPAARTAGPAAGRADRRSPAVRQRSAS